jgi:hypothetical protein
MSLNILNKQFLRWLDRQTDRQTDRQADRQTDRIPTLFKSTIAITSKKPGNVFERDSLFGCGISFDFDQNTIAIVEYLQGELCFRSLSSFQVHGLRIILSVINCFEH